MDEVDHIRTIKYLLKQLSLCAWAQEDDAISAVAFRYGVECPVGFHDGKAFRNEEDRRRVLKEGSTDG